MKPNFLIYLLLTFSFVTSCGKNTKNIDVSNIPVEFDIIRFEKELFKIDTTNIHDELTTLNNKYKSFTNIYFNHIVPLYNKNGDTTLMEQHLSGFINYPNVKFLADTTALIFADFSSIEKDLTHAFKYLKHYFPNKNTPNIYTFISEYSYQSFIFEDQKGDAIGVGLDMFLGENYPYNQKVSNIEAFSQYLTKYYDKKYLVKRVIDTYVDDLVGVNKETKLIDIMIHNGKKKYIASLLLPNLPEHIIMEYDEKDIDWVKKNRHNIWAHFTSSDLLYSSDSRKISKLINKSPMGPPSMPKDSPGEIGNWLGWKIVEKYMERNPNLTIQDLINQKDAQKILTSSKYKPKK